MTVSPLAPTNFPLLPVVAGVSFAVTNSGIRYKDRPDLLYAEFAAGTQVAGVLTRSLTASAAIDWCKTALCGGSARALVVNAGNANAFTGKVGEASVLHTAEAAAQVAACRADEVFIASTGVIGVPLPHEKITQKLAGLKAALRADAWEDAAASILTTDTFKKTATRTAFIDDVPVVINGFAKGSGMIAPDMATMLAFMVTDAALPAQILQVLLSDINERSFNAITVDSDTSTSDTALLFATAQATHTPVVSADDTRLTDFRQKLESLMMELAHLIVKDGEGATKFVEITVQGAEHDKAAKHIALAVANSPLVKTAIAGNDANWGRIVAAIGKAGERANRDALNIWIGGVLVAKDGLVNPDYVEVPVTSEYMKGQHIEIRIDVGIAAGKATVWTCDLTHRYIDINGSYRS